MIHAKEARERTTGAVNFFFKARPLFRGRRPEIVECITDVKNLIPNCELANEAVFVEERREQKTMVDWMRHVFTAAQLWDKKPHQFGNCIIFGQRFRQCVDLVKFVNAFVSYMEKHRLPLVKAV